MYTGANLQATFAAWCAVLALAEETSQLPDVAVSRITRVGAEQNWPLDDNALWFENDARAFAQVKERLASSDGDSSEFASVVEQIVEQHFFGRGREHGTEPLTDNDRFVIVVGSATGAPIREDLGEALLRIASHPPEDEIVSAAQGQPRLEVQIRRVIRHVERILMRRGMVAETTVVRRILTRTRIVAVTENDLRERARLLLSTKVLEDGQNVLSAFAVLERLFSSAGEDRTSHDVPSLRRRLADAGLALVAPRSIAADARSLIAQTQQTVRRERRTINTPEGVVEVRRSVVPVVVRAARTGSLAITAKGGGGKSAVVLQAAQILHEAGERVVFIDLVGLAEAADIGAALRLDRRIEDVLTPWAQDGRVGFIFLDGLDALRLGKAADGVLRLLRELRQQGGRWHVIATSREFDLETSKAVQAEFPVLQDQMIPHFHRDERFDAVAHIVVRDFDEGELAQVTAVSPLLAAVLANAEPRLREVLSNPFNLSIAADLVGPHTDFSTILERVDLLDAWWDHRIAVKERWKREDAVTSVVRHMVERRRLDIAPRELSPLPDALDQLTSDSVFVTRGPRADRIAFSHALLFDYATYRVVFAEPSSITALMVRDRDAFVFVLPSIRMRLDVSWRKNRTEFYEFVAAMFASGTQRFALLVLVCRVIVEGVQSFKDLEPILLRTGLPGERAVRYLVRAVIRSRQLGEMHILRSRDSWIDFVLATSKRETLQHDTLLLLTELTENDPESRDDVRVVATARRCLQREFGATDINSGRRNMAIDAFFRTYDTDPAGGRVLLERLFDRQRLSQYGPYEFNVIGYHLKYIKNVAALELAYDVVFSEIPVPSGNVAMGADSAIFGMVQNASQPLRSARWALGELYPTLLDSSPRAAVRALVAAIGMHQARYRADGRLVFEIDGARRAFSADHEEDVNAQFRRSNDWAKMQRAFEQRLTTTLADGDRRFADAVLAEATERVIPATLLRVLLRHAHRNVHLATSLVPVVADAEVLGGHDLADAAATYLDTAFEQLEVDGRRRIEASIVAVMDAEFDKAQRRAWRDRRLDLLLAGIPEHSLSNPRLLARKQRPLEGPADQREAALNLRGYHIAGAVTEAFKASEKATHHGATAEVAEAIDEAAALMPTQGQVPPHPDLLAPMARRFYSLLTTQEGEVCEEVLDMASALVQYALERGLLTVEEQREFTPIVLLAAKGMHPVPQEHAEDDEHAGASWGWPNARILAAQSAGPMFRTTRDPALLEVVERLSQDLDPSVRGMALHAAWHVAHVEAARGWAIVERAVADPARGVIYTAMSVASSLAPLDQRRYRRLEFEVYDRLTVTQSETQLVKDLQRNVLYRAIGGDELARERLRPALEAPWRHPAVAHNVALDLAMALRHVDDSMRSAARDMLLTLTNVLREYIEAVGGAAGLDGYERYDVSKIADSVRAEIEACAKILVAIAERLYFDSGAFGASDESEMARGSEVEFTDRKFRLVQPLIQALAPIPYSNVAYNVLRVLVVAIDLDPPFVLRVGSASLLAGIAGGLANEYLGQQEGALFIMHYVERHRNVLTGDRDALRSIMDVIDAFADAGWPDWIDVVFAIDRVYREE